MFWKKTYGIDMGSGSIKVYSLSKDKTIIEKNLVAYEDHTVIAVGNDAYEIFERNPENIKVEPPMAFGMIANKELAEIILYTTIRKLRFLRNRGNYYFSVPPDMSAMEKRTYYNLANGNFLRGNRVWMIENPIADAVAMEVDFENTLGSMIVNIGDETTQMSIFSEGRMIISKTIPIGGKQMNESICTEIRKRYQLHIGMRTARRLKLVMGRLNTDKKEARKVVGVDCLSGFPRETVISSYVVGDGIRNCVTEIAEEIKIFLERTPPQIGGYIARNGIYLAGGSTRIPFLDHHLAMVTGVSFRQSPLYENVTLQGLKLIMQDKKMKKKWAVPIQQRTF